MAAFNARSEPDGAFFRRILADLCFGPWGFDVVHIELGEDPYEVDALGNLRRTAYRKEHFGFADGVSQPFVDLENGILYDPRRGEERLLRTALGRRSRRAKSSSASRTGMGSPTSRR